MMSADAQFELYLTVNETNRGGGTGVDATAKNSTRGPVDQARNAAANFAQVVRRRAFTPISSRISEQAEREDESC